MSGNLHSKRRSRNNEYKFNFSSVPDVGIEIDYYKGKLILIDVRGYVRKDGASSSILVWRRSDGVIGASGLRSKSLSYPDWTSEYA